MRGITLVGAVAVMVSVLAASGVALAKTIDCIAGTNCFGTNKSDTMTGTSGADNMFGRGGKDTMRGKGSADSMEGGTGADEVIGGSGDDPELWGGTLTIDATYPDKSDDTVRGGRGNDTIYGGRGQGGMDHVFGGDGNDFIDVTQRTFPGDVQVTKEVVDCGAGDQDRVYFDNGKDVIAKNCEVQKFF
jgi:Ca2+-binding RTX toxin-like protein